MLRLEALGSKGEINICTGQSRDTETIILEAEDTLKGAKDV